MHWEADAAEPACSVVRPEPPLKTCAVVYAQSSRFQLGLAEVSCPQIPT